MIIDEYYTLHNGVKMPKFGLGTWLSEHSDVEHAIHYAIKAGYKMIDSAQGYGNEVEVGRAIKEVKREDIFITSKVQDNYKSYQEAYDSILKSLERLDTPYIDLMLIHCPQLWSEYRGPNRHLEDNVEVWRALEHFYKEGKIRAIGVSNFDRVDLQNILDHCEIKPMVNQFLTQCAFTPVELIQFCKEHDIVCEAYCPLGHGSMFKDELVIQMAKKYNVSVAQLAIRYTLQLGMVSIPKSTKEERIIENSKVDFEILPEDMEVLIKHGYREDL